MRISVTAEDISRGKPEDDCLCPVARAIRRHTYAPTSVSLGKAVVDYATPDAKEYWLPEEVISFIEDFDAGCQVPPIEFGFADSGSEP